MPPTTSPQDSPRDNPNRQPGVPLRLRDADKVAALLQSVAPDAAPSFIRLHAYAQQHGVGMSAIGHQTRINTSVLSPCYNATYTGDYHAIAARIDTFFWHLEQKEKYGGNREFADMQLAFNLWSIFEKTRIIRRIQIIESPEQLGKTRAAQEYTRRNNSGRTIYLQLSGGSRNGVGDFIWELANRLDIAISTKMREKRLQIKSSLEACDLVIIDEAHLSDAWTDAAQRDFWDYVRTDVFDSGKRGVVLICTDHDLVKGIRKFGRRSGYNTGQLFGRMRNETVRIDPAEDITIEDVAALIGRYYTPGDSALEKLTDIARRPGLGHFGLLDDILNEAWAIAKSKKRKLTDSQVLAIAKQILLQLKDNSERNAA